MTERLVTVEELTETADAIRGKLGSSSDITWIKNYGFKSAIESIPSGSGSAVTIIDEEDEHGGTIRHIYAVSLAGDTVRPDVLGSGYIAHNALGEPIVGIANIGGTINLQTRSVTPTETLQPITAEAGYDGLELVNVAAIPSTYVGSGIARKSSSDLTASGATVSVPAGYYESSASKSVTTMTLPTSADSSATSGYTSKATLSRNTADRYINIPPGYNSAGGYYKIDGVPNGSVTAPSTISGSTATVSTGTNTLTLTKTVSVTPNVTTAGYISTGTAGNASVSLSASVTTKAAATYYPSASDQTISASQYLTGAQTIKGVTTTNLTADNIKSGVTVEVGDSTDSDRILSIVGTYSGGGGGGGIGTLLSTTSLGTINTTSTQAASLNISLSVPDVNSYDLLIVESSVNSITNNRHTATVGLIFLTASSSSSTKNGATVATMKLNSKISSSAVTTTTASTTAYGVYPNSCTVSTSGTTAGTASIPMYRRYNSTYTGTLNGTYTARVYGVNLLDLIGG